MNDTIAAISTTMGVGAVSIIRISGKDSIEIANKVFDKKNLQNKQSHTIHYGHIIDNKEIVDEVLLSIMKAPKTFTREDVVEINCHGGISTTKKVLEIILKNGARLAEPGEFTKRAFINGRIDLIEAESIKDLVNAKTESSRKLAINQLNGNLSNLVKKFRQELLELIASIEVNIDYPEYEDIEIITNNNIQEKMINIKNKLNNIINESENSKIIKNGINIILLGKPNVGKSSLLNKLINEDRAIVTDIKGTTRDIVEGQFELNGTLINIIDTAGIRETKDIIEKIGIDKSIKKLDTSDLVILLLNSNEELTEEDTKLLEITKHKNRIIVVNKNDLDNKINLKEINEELIYINTIKDNGIKPLKEKIIELFDLNKLNQNDYNIFTNIRQISLAKEALEITKEIEIGLKNKMPIDLIEIDIKRIWETLGKIIGETYSEELLDQLFSQFCLGK